MESSPSASASASRGDMKASYEDDSFRSGGIVYLESKGFFFLLCRLSLPLPLFYRITQTHLHPLSFYSKFSLDSQPCSRAASISLQFGHCACRSETAHMGNCVLKGPGERNDVVKVVTADGGIMELFTPITAECITGEYPGHAIFTSRSIFSEPLLHKDELHAGQLYYLLPLNPYKPSTKLEADAASVVSTPYRMSTCETQNAASKKRAAAAEAEVFPKYSSTGVWKVKLVISPEQLSEILSQDNRTEELIENVRTVAKCGNGVGSAANSDHSSVAGSWKGSASAMDKPQYGFK